jgi:nicotinate-nucleotide pyrophosphorylase (carboxylating)
MEYDNKMVNLPATQQITADVLKAIDEDLGTGDITGLLIDEKQQAKAYIKTREPMILCGTSWAEKAFHLLDPGICLQWSFQEGNFIEANTILCFIEGTARSILSAERTALNFLQTLSATATQTYRYVKMLAGTNTILLDTRKTIPGMRVAQKYAVRCGGGQNHRFGLFDAFLIKENHIIASGSITDAIHKARALFPQKKLEIEVETLNEFQEALAASPDIIMLDNFDLRMIRQVMEIRTSSSYPKVLLEVSGNINLSSIREFAETGVEYISTGAITKHIQAIDLTLLFV